MPQPTFVPGAPCWIDLFTSDPDKSRSFYGELFGWTSQDMGEEYGGYITFTSKEGAAVAGGMRNDGQAGMPDAWTVYLTTDNAKETVDAAAASGGQVIVPATEVMDLGTMAVVTDPGHAAIGTWQPGVFQGFGDVGETGTPAWFELQTRDYDASVEFYKSVFKWDAHTAADTPGFRYTTLGEGENQAAGIMDAVGFLPEGVPAHWGIYFRVDDVDATLAKVVELGGSVTQPAEDTPYGRLAGAVDPTGAPFKLMTPPAS